MNHIEFGEGLLYTLLVISFILCGFCAASETGLMALNRYRLRHLAKTDVRAKRITKLLSHPDRLLGAILIGSIFGTALGSSIFNELAGKYFGHVGVFLSPLLFTLILLILAESTPKTLAALKPEATAKFVSRPLQIMLWMLYPMVLGITLVSNGLLRLFGVHINSKVIDSLNTEELRTVVNEASGLIPTRHQKMLLSILDLEKVRVDHIMVPRNEVIGIDLDDDPGMIMDKLINIQHTLLPVYRSDLDSVLGIFHTRNTAKVVTNTGLNEKALLAAMEDSYFIPEGTSLHTQLLNFQQNKRRLALVVDEYGEVLGLVTLEDILEEIVGEFTTDVAGTEQEIFPQEDGSFLVNGGITVRDLNRALSFELPTDGPTTLNGLIIETLEYIPEAGVSVLITGYPIEVVEMKENMIKIARLQPRLKDWEAENRESR